MMTQSTMPKPTLHLRGFDIHVGYLDRAAQAALLGDIKEILVQAPFYAPKTPSGKAMSVRMTSAGDLGWCTDARGYRYEPLHPNGSKWPAIPNSVLRIWRQLIGGPARPSCCLINYYGEGAKMGLHQDKDEGDFSFPVLSISLGDDGLFRMGNQARKGASDALWLHSGDVVVMGGAARLSYHGVDKIRFRSSGLLGRGGRINLTLRVVRPPETLAPGVPGS